MRRNSEQTKLVEIKGVCEETHGGFDRRLCYRSFGAGHGVVKDFGPCLVGSKEYIKVFRQRYQVHNSCFKILISQWLWWIQMVCERTFHNWYKNKNKHFTKEKLQTASKHLGKKWLVSFVIK